MEKTTKELLESIVSTGGVSAFGGISYYLYEVSKGENFVFTMFFINIFLAFWIGFVVGNFLPESLGEYKNGLLSISGFTAYPILGILKKRGGDYITKKIGLDSKKKKG